MESMSQPNPPSCNILMKSILLKTFGAAAVVVLLGTHHTKADSPPLELRSGLESYWPMDDDLNDWLTGTAGVIPEDASFEFSIGLYDNALIAEAPGSGIALSHRATPGGGALSGSFWFTPFALGVSGQVMLQDGTAWCLHRNAETDELALTSAGATVALPGDWEDGGWHHLAFSVRSGGTLTVWVDGEASGEAVAGPLLPGSGWLSVGADPAHPSDGVGLCLDEVALWTRELSPTELEDLYAPEGGTLASVLGPAPQDYRPAQLTVVRDPAPNAVLTWVQPAGILDNYEIEISSDLSQWSVLGPAESGFSDPIPATPDAKRFYRVYRKVEP